MQPSPRAQAPLHERLHDFYTRVTTERHAALDELPDLFSPDIHFINPVVDDHGLANFTAQWRRAFRLYKVFRFADIRIDGAGDRFTLSYTMQIRFLVGPTFDIPLTTVVEAHAGKITRMRDYFDTFQTLLQPLPPVLALYRWALRFLIV